MHKRKNGVTIMEISKLYHELPEFAQQQADRVSLDAYITECEQIDARSKKAGFISPVDASRKNTLISFISLVKEQRVSSDAIRVAELNASLLADGQRPVIFNSKLDKRRKGLIESYRKIIRGVEIRDVQTSGQGIISYPNASGSTFVPTEFVYSGLQAAMKTHSPLFDPEVVSYAETSTGRGVQVPLLDDTGAQASVVAEGVDNNPSWRCRLNGRKMRWPI
jgi:hypothetical protein